MLDVVYHCSPVQGLTMLTPRVGTHGHAWVYATDDVAMASVFLGRLGGDFTCGTGTHHGTPYLVERFAGAVDRRYGGVRGSIYVLPAEGFMAGKTSWSKDLVCDHPVTPLEETPVDDAKSYLLRLAEQGRLILKFYPERFYVPDDDEDLVERAVRKVKVHGPGVLDQVKEFHPYLLARVRQAIQENRY